MKVEELLQTRFNACKEEHTEAKRKLNQLKNYLILCVVMILILEIIAFLSPLERITKDIFFNIGVVFVIAGVSFYAGRISNVEQKIYSLEEQLVQLFLEMRKLNISCTVD